MITDEVELMNKEELVKKIAQAKRVKIEIEWSEIVGDLQPQLLKAIDDENMTEAVLDPIKYSENIQKLRSLGYIVNQDDVSCKVTWLAKEDKS